MPSLLPLCCGGPPRSRAWGRSRLPPNVNGIGPTPGLRCDGLGRVSSEAGRRFNEVYDLAVELRKLGVAVTGAIGGAERGFFNGGCQCVGVLKTDEVEQFGQHAGWISDKGFIGQRVNLMPLAEIGLG